MGGQLVPSGGPMGIGLGLGPCSSSAGDASSLLGADHMSMEGGESGGSGSLRSFELPALRNSDSFNSAKVRNHLLLYH